MKEIIRFNENVTPNRIIVQERADGKTNIFFQDKGMPNHGHTVRNSSGTIDYARTMGGNILKNG